MTARNQPTAAETAIAAWAAPVPDWIMALASACDDSGRGRVADRLGYSPAVISQVLSCSYKGDMARIEGLVRGAYLAATVHCPVNGDIPVDVCLIDQRREPPFASSWRYRVHRACRNGCPNFRGRR